MEEEQPQSLPTELDRWLDDRAAETGRERGEVLARAVATHRLLTDAADATDVPPLEQQLAELADRIDELEAETDDQIEDVRDRVIQVARSRAESDHDHPELEARIDEVERDGTAEIATLRRVLASLERRVDGGFDNYEAVLSSLTDRADDTERKLDMLASAIVDLRKRVTELEAANARRDAVEELQADANRRNVGTADCEHCGKRVHVGLLSDPRCPHCGESFVDVEPGSRFLGSATLVTGDQPALTGESFDPAPAEEVFDDDG